MKQLEARSKRILVIDDEAMVGRFVGDVLTKAGYEVTYSQNAVEGIHWAMESRPSLVLTDYEMPQINGAELCIQLKSREETRHIPVVVMSGLVGNDGHEVARFSGAAGYFEKPLSSRRLVSAIRDLVSE